jgi:NTP pyrophosphatase (non-canonical NTP hydrolase)
VADVDGALWEHQTSGHGCYRMTEADRRAYADTTSDTEGVRPWPYLLGSDGPLTEVQAPASHHGGTEWRGLTGGIPHHAEYIADQLRRNGFDPADAVNRQVLNLAEEAGEFVGAYRRWTGQARRTGTAAAMHEELADVIITAFVTAHELGVDIDQVIAIKLHKIHTRGWREAAAPTNRRTP